MKDEGAQESGVRMKDALINYSVTTLLSVHFTLRFALCAATLTHFIVQTRYIASVHTSHFILHTAILARG